VPTLRPLPAILLAALTSLPAAPATAARLFVAAASHHRSGIRTLRLDRAVLRDLRARRDATLEAFPLGDRRTADLVLTRIAPFPPGAHIEAMHADGPHVLPIPDAAYFGGTVAGEPGSRVVLVADRTRVHGFVVSGGEIYPFGPDRHARHRSYPLSRAAVATGPTDFCRNDLGPDVLGRGARLAASVATTAASGTLRVADVAIDTDNELRNKFPSDQATLDYLGALFAAATTIYERDLNVRLQFPWVRIWAPDVADPWTKTDPYDALQEVMQVWDNPFGNMYPISSANDLVHFISGKDVHGGITNVDRLCNNYYAFGVSQVYGAFDLADPSSLWDVMVVTHEMGHTFGSTHTHCYDPPLDHCWNIEPGCYSGPAEQSQGTIMSYCNHWPGGMANIDLTFGPTVAARIAQSVAAAPCLDTVTTTSTIATTSTTQASTTTSTSTTLSTATTLPGTTSTVATLPSTTSTTVPPDADHDGVPAASDACPDTPAGDLVDATGCSVCPCAGPSGGGAWPSRAAFLRCVRRAAHALGARSARDAVRHGQRSSCGRPAVTRCCVYTGTSDTTGACRVLAPAACARRANAVDVGAGSCAPQPCARQLPAGLGR